MYKPDSSISPITNPNRLPVPIFGVWLQAFILLCFTSVSAQTQYSSVIHYDQTNGFPGSNAYNVFQDSKGYIWISTENGLARFNGCDFKLFTSKDGLPDNEVFYLNEDIRGRLWYAPFTNNVGYIKDDKVYDKRNDPLLRIFILRIDLNKFYSIVMKTLSFAKEAQLPA